MGKPMSSKRELCVASLPVYIIPPWSAVTVLNSILLILSNWV